MILTAILLPLPDYFLMHRDIHPESEKISTPEKEMIALYGREKVARFIDPELFEKNHVVAYYGHPNSKIMGIVGRLSKEKLAATLKEKAALYDNLNGERGVIPAIYIIHGTCQPAGNINIINQDLVKSYIDLAIENDFLVFLDHQIGKYSLQHAMNLLLPYLKYPNVHLAIDLEWRTTRPMEVIGFITGNELNDIQAMMQKYIIDNNIPGKRKLVFHQFNYKMLRNSSLVKAAYDPVLLVHTTSGWGRPKEKLATHERNAKVSNIPYKGFKLWYYYSSKKGVHYDEPLMSPSEVLALKPQPGLIIYQ